MACTMQAGGAALTCEGVCLQAETSGTVVKFLADNKSMVSSGQVQLLCLLQLHKCWVVLILCVPQGLLLIKP